MNRAIAIILIISFSISCDEITVRDIRDDAVELKTPANDALLEDEEVLFWWIGVEDATHYQLSIVTPDYAGPQELVLDTVIVSTQFKTTLSPRKYEWCVTGLNAGYETLSSCRKLEVTN